MKPAESCPLDQIRKALVTCERCYDRPVYVMIGVSEGYYDEVSDAVRRELASFGLTVPARPAKLFGVPLVIDDTLPRCSFAIRMRPTL